MSTKLKPVMLEMKGKLNEDDKVTFLFALLVLFVGLVLDGTKKGENDSGLRVDAHGRHEDLAAALHNVSTGKNHLKKSKKKSFFLSFPKICRQPSQAQDSSN